MSGGNSWTQLATLRQMAQRKPVKVHRFFLGAGAIGVEVALLLLAHWQWNRYQQRLTEQVNFNAQPKITLEGTFLNGQTAALDNQPNPIEPEEQMGWRILTPLQTSSTLIIIDRGWSPPHFKADQTTPDFTSFTSSATYVTGTLQSFPQRNGWLSGPDTTTSPHLLAFLNPQRITSASTAKTYLIATENTGTPGIIAVPPPLPAPLRHLSYALQWLGMALAFPLLCAAAFFKNRRSGR